MRRSCAGPAAITLCVSCAMAAGNAQAQQPLSVSVRADNDAFNFWMPPYARPDEEYTSGVRGTLEYAGGAWWERWLHQKTVPCTAGAGPCATRTFSLGQDSYTGTLAPGDTSYVPGGRPDAGWLYVQESSRIASDSHLDETSVTIGVTGPPSLAQATQRFFHSLAPEFNHTFDWSHQLPFEPGIIVAYEHTQRVLVFGEGKPFGGEFEPHVGASLGNILTEGTAGVRARTGFRLHHPWLLAAQSTTPEVAFFIDATMHGVVRNEFLAGTMFRSSDHVQERPFVPEYQGGVSVRWRRLTAAYSVDRTGSEYSARATGHSWSRLALEWRLAR